MKKQRSIYIILLSTLRQTSWGKDTDSLSFIMTLSSALLILVGGVCIQTRFFRPSCLRRRGNRQENTLSRLRVWEAGCLFSSSGQQGNRRFILTAQHSLPKCRRRCIYDIRSWKVQEDGIPPKTPIKIMHFSIDGPVR